jgi:uncharacterized protein YwqG
VSVEFDEIAALTGEIAAATHVGRRNRLTAQRNRLFDAIDGHPGRLALLRALLDHAKPDVRLAAAWRCGWGQVALEEAERAVAALTGAPGEIGRNARHWLDSRARLASDGRQKPPAPKTLTYQATPAGYSRAEAIALLTGAVSKAHARKLLPLLRRAIGVWPQASADDPAASCFGGMPAQPAGQAWPRCDDEPLLFLGQINCAELHAAVGDNPFPKRGLLQFYGDHDEVTGCGATGGSAVFYFTDPGALRQAPAPVPEFRELGRCGLAFYEAFELPHPLSESVYRLGLTPDEEADYRDLRDRLAALGGAERRELRSSKLLGWPDLLQRDLGEDSGEPDAGESLLLQLGWYHNGAVFENWGPGGQVYFILDEGQLAERRFDLAAMEMQCT